MWWMTTTSSAVVCLTDASGQCGITLAILQHLSRPLAGWKPINNHLMMAHIQHKLGKLTVTVVYDPTIVVDEHMKDKNYCLLQSVLENISTHDISIVLTDANVMLASVSHDPQLLPHIMDPVLIDQIEMTKASDSSFYAIVLVTA